MGKLINDLGVDFEINCDKSEPILTLHLTLEQAQFLRTALFQTVAKGDDLLDFIEEVEATSAYFIDVFNEENH